MPDRNLAVSLRSFVAAFGVASLLVACGSTGGGSASAETPVEPRGTPIERLPERERAALEAWRAGESAWLESRDTFVHDPALAAFLVDNLVVVLVRSYDSGHVPREGVPVRPFERARAELVRLPEFSGPVLAELLVVGDGVVAYLATDVLRRLPGGVAAPAVAERLTAERVEQRRRAADVLERLQDAGTAEHGVQASLARLLVSDPEMIVRAQAARALGARAGRGVVAEPTRLAALDALSRALSDHDPDVRASAAVGLAELGDVRAVPALVQALGRALQGTADRTEVRALQTTLRRLTGEPQDQDLAGWRAWLDRNVTRVQR